MSKALVFEFDTLFGYSDGNFVFMPEREVKILLDNNLMAINDIYSCLEIKTKKIIEEERVGPSLGKQAVSSGLISYLKEYG